MITDVAFERLVPLLRANQIDEVATVLIEAGEPARRALEAPLQAYLRCADCVPYSWLPPGETPDFRFEILQRHNAAAAVAGTACLSSATKIVTWLRGGWFTRNRDLPMIDAMIRVLRAPGRPAFGAIARSLATKMRPVETGQNWWFVSRLLAAAGEPVPVTEATLTGWIRENGLMRGTGPARGTDPARESGSARESGRSAEVLRADPHTAELLPHLFTIPRVNALLGPEAAADLAEIAADSLRTRAVLLAGCVSRLAEGDRPGAIRPIVDLHQRLAPTVDECFEQRHAYLTMLSSPHSTVADLAQRALRTADEAGLLPPDVIAEASWAVLPRREKKLVRAQLDWLAAALDRKPDLLLFEALLTGLTHESADVAERTLRLAGRQLATLGPAGQEQLARAGEGLTGDLRRQVTALLPAVDAGKLAADAGKPAGARPVAGTDGASVGGSDGGSSADAVFLAGGASDVRGPAAFRAVVSPAAPMPEPIRTPPELLAALLMLLSEEAQQPVLFEQALDGLVRLVRTDRAELAAGLEPHVPQWYSSLFACLLRAVVTGTWPGWDPGSQAYLYTAPPMWMRLERLRELAGQMAGTPPPALLATPATVDGHVDPRRVLALLTLAEDEHWQPGPFDLSQPLLRLPRDVDPAVAADAERLTSPAGRLFATWLRTGGLPDPAIVTLNTVLHTCPDPDDCTCRMRSQPRRTTAFEPMVLPVPVDPSTHPTAIGMRARSAYEVPRDRPTDDPPAPTGPAPSSDVMAFAVPAGLLALPAVEAIGRDSDSHRPVSMTSWPMILPGHPEIVAAHALPRLALAADGDHQHQLGLLPVLATSTGPFGPAMALSLAYGFTAGRATGRVAATDAFLELAARGKLDPALVGRELAHVHATGRVVMKRVAGCLTEALRAGAGAEVWATVRELLPTALTDPGPGTPDLLMVAEAAASATHATDDIPEVTTIATQRGRTRLITEAARLSRTLTANRTAG
jgi:hypothetical protein